VAVNRSIMNLDPSIYLHANCSTQMVSPALFKKTLLDYECALAARLRPFGIHHCGNNLHLFAEGYARTGAVFYDVGWGSNVERCSQALPDAFLNLRLSPVRMQSQSVEQATCDVELVLAAANRTERVGVCCINMDAGTPDANVIALLETARG
jgi:hypothetical protein